ncbi:MAG: hypothetical protein AAGF78_13680 [Pseudomonadota bacterium]
MIVSRLTAIPPDALQVFSSTDAPADAAAVASEALAMIAHNVGLSSWLSVQQDAAWAISDRSAQEPPLYYEDGDQLHEVWKTVRLNLPTSEHAKSDRAKSRAAQGYGDWTFWIDWFDGHIAGKPLPVDGLLEPIVKLPEALWTDDPAELNRQVMAIYEAWKAAPKPSHSQDFLQAAIYQFEYDVAERLMRAVPFPDDWRELTDPDQLKAMLEDVASLRKAMDRFKRSLEYEGRAMQGGGALRAYLEDIEGEFAAAEDVERLLVGEIVELRRALDNLAKREALRTELGDYCEPLDDILRRLTDILHKHFSSTLARFSVLRDVELEADTNPRDVLATLREVVEAMRSGSGGAVPHLLAKDAASLDLLLDDLERLIREVEIAESAEQVSSLRREMNFLMAKVLASGSLYIQEVNEALPLFSGKPKRINDTIDAAVKVERRVTTVGRWSEAVWEALKSL